MRRKKVKKGKNEKKFKNLTEITTDWIWEVDKNGIYTYVSPKVKELLGYEVSEILGKTPFDLMPEEEAERVSRIFREKVIYKRPFYGLENINYHKDGHLIILETSGIPIFDEKGQLKGYRGIDRDITERKRAEDKLKQYQFMVEFAHDAIFFKDLKSRYIIANNKTLEAFGLPREKVIGKNDYEIMPDKKEARMNVEDDQIVFKTGKPKEIVKHITGADGNEYWFQAIKTPQFDDKGKGNVVGLVGVARDVTELKRAQDEVVAARDYTDNIIKSMIDTLIVADSKGKIKTINPATVNLLGYKEEELIDKPVATVFEKGKEVTPFKGTRMKKLIEEGSIRDYDMTYKTKSGEKIPVSFSGSVMRDKEENLIGIIGVARDMRETRKLISNLENVIQELEQTQNQLIQKEKMASIGQLAAGVAHELNNPLTIILGHLELLLKEAKDQKIKNDLKIVYPETKRCAEIVESLLEFSRKSEFKLEPVSINRILTSTLRLIEYQLTLKNIKVIKYKHSLPKISGDANRLRQVFNNLIWNASASMPKGGEIRISTFPDDEKKNVKIVFSDTGRGIPEEKQKRIFDPFFTTAEPGKGIGLGLYASYTIIDAHGGKIEVESQLNKGSTFTVTLPLTPPKSGKTRLPHQRSIKA